MIVCLHCYGPGRPTERSIASVGNDKDDKLPTSDQYTVAAKRELAD